MTMAPDPGRYLLDRIDAREQALAREAGDVQARIDELTARLGELSQAIIDLQVTRKTLLALAGEDDAQPAAEPAEPLPVLPDHPACQQILTAFGDLQRPLRARDLPGPGPARRDTRAITMPDRNSQTDAEDHTEHRDRNALTGLKHLRGRLI